MKMKRRTRTLWTVAFMAVVLAWLRPGLAQTTQPAATPKTDLDRIEDMIQKSKNPIPGFFNWGMDLRLRFEYLNNVSTLDKSAPNHEQIYNRYKGRWWGTVTPTKDIEFNVKLTWEGRSWCENDTIAGWDSSRDQVIFDNVYLKWRNFLGLPLTVTAGRQDILLGDGWWTGDGGPLDGSRSYYYDAVRLDYALPEIKTDVTTIWIQQDAQGDAWFPKIDNRPVPALMTEQDEEGAILWISNKSLPNMEIDPYFVYKNDKTEVVNGKEVGRTGDYYMFGTRVAGKIGDHWQYRDDIAGQFGHRNGQQLCALGSLNQISYNFNDKLQNRLYVDYEFESGDDPGTKGTNEEFDMMWGRYPRWTELYFFTYAMESRIANLSNLHRIGPGWGCKPTDKLELDLRYDLLFADENTVGDQPGGQAKGFSKDGCFRGFMITPYAKYTLNNHMFTRLMPSVFCPGDFYTNAHNDTAVFFRWEIVLTW
jgi:hypothetical protein